MNRNGLKRTTLKLWPVALLAAVAVGPAMRQGRAQQNPASDDGAVLAHLNAVISWYKNITTKAPPEREPSDSIYQSNAENFAGQVVRLAFQSARAQAELQSRPTGSENGTSGQSKENASAPPQRYAQTESEVSQRIADDQSQIAALKEKYGRSGKRDLLAQEESLEGKLALDKATLDAVQHLQTFAEQANAGGNGLKGSINELARSVPEVLQAQVNSKQTAPQAATPAKTSNATQSGLLGELIALYGEMNSIRSIEQRLDENDDIQKIATNLRIPLRNELTGTLNQEQQLTTQKEVTKAQYDDLTKRFRDISAALLPLSEEVLVLDQSRSNYVQWRKATGTESRVILVSILSRVALILISVGIVLGLAEIWRRLTFRYVRDPRRRRQFLITRRVVIGFLIGLVLILGFASEFSSLATFAGFVTAGIAVGLQAILLSVAAYFFVIGRYGISVGDRISVAGVTGDVIDVGLMRFYLMEFASTGPDLYPTGRIVVFPNSVLFQASTPLFKQFPGTRYTWHEAVVPLAPKADYELVQKTLEAAIDPVYKEYRLDTLWHRRPFDETEIAINPPTLEHRVQLAENGPELVARYPVELGKAGEIDDKITKSLMTAIQRDDKLANAVAGSPKIRSVVRT
ncbi:MAG TPA: hypothetical protein VEJ47_14865 [Candidatus Eremiobacteraceae bacterium]|nr:hypothetical protein [Candidatus Eremiobacteraceae bacterium]